VLLGAIVFTLKAQQLEKERAAPDVGGVIPYLRNQRLHGFIEFACLK